MQKIVFELADARQLFAHLHVNDALAANACVGDHHARVLLYDLTDDSGLLAHRVLAHGGNQGFRHKLWHNRQELAFICDIERIEAEKHTGGAYCFGYGQFALV